MSQTTSLFTKFYTNADPSVSIKCTLDCEGVSINPNSDYKCYLIISPDGSNISMTSSYDHDFITDAYDLIKGESNNLSLPDTVVSFDSELLNNIKEINEGKFWVKAFPFEVDTNNEENYLTPSQSVELNIEDVIDAKMYASVEGSNLTVTVEFNDNLQYYDLEGSDWNYSITFFSSENSEISSTQGILNLIESSTTYVISNINLPEGTKHFSFNLNGIHEDWIYNEDASTIYCNVDIYCSLDLLVQEPSIGTFSKDKFKIKVTLLQENNRWSIDAFNGKGQYKIYYGYSWSMNPNVITWINDNITRQKSIDMGIGLSAIPKPDKPLQFLHFKVIDSDGKIAYATYQNNNILQCSQMINGSTIEYKYEIKKDSLPSILIKPNYKHFNMLFIGNSFCSAFPDELKGIAEYDNVFIDMYSVYKAGCYLWEQQKYWEEKTKAYKFHYFPTADIKNRITYNNFNIDDCLNFKNKWHHISLQGHFGYDWMTNTDAYNEVIMDDSDYPLDDGKTRGEAELEHARYLYNYLQNYPTSEKAKLYWNETWSYDVGWNRVSGYVQSVENQKIQYDNIKYMSEQICKQSPKPIFAPCGDAWQIARQMIFGDLPDTTTSVSDVKHLLTYESDNGGDRYHDGQEGGGEYLNGCVWYEILTGNDCRGNMWIPPYEMTNSRFLLQEAAHEAVLAIR